MRFVLYGQLLKDYFLSVYSQFMRENKKNSLIMPKTCAVVGCGVRADRDGCRFSRFPAIDHRSQERLRLSKLRQHRWLTVLKREDLRVESLKHVVVCYRHFVEGKAQLRFCFVAY